MAKAQSADQQSGHNLVAQAQQQRAFEHAVAKPDSCAHGDIVAAEQRQFHRKLALRHPITHRRNTASDLCGRALFARPHFDLFRVSTIRLMRRKHVVIGGDDPDVHRIATTNGGLVVAARREAMRKVSARQCRSVHPCVARARNQVQIGRAPRFRLFDNPVGNGLDDRVELIHASSLHRVRQAQWRHSAPSFPHHNFWV